MNWITDIGRLPEFEDYRLLVQLKDYPVFKLCDFDSDITYCWYFDSGLKVNLRDIVQFIPLGKISDL